VATARCCLSRLIPHSIAWRCPVGSAIPPLTRSPQPKPSAPGSFLPGDNAEWLRPVRDTVRTTHIAVLRALTRHAASPEQREHYLLQLLRHDPYDEQSHRQLIHVLRTAGRYGEARRRCRNYVRRMAEIGVTVTLQFLPPG